MIISINMVLFFKGPMVVVELAFNCVNSDYLRPKNISVVDFVMNIQDIVA